MVTGAPTPRISWALTWITWHVLVPATAAKRCLDSLNDGALLSPLSSPVEERAATVPIHPAYLHDGQNGYYYRQQLFRIAQLNLRIDDAATHRGTQLEAKFGSSSFC
jgi:hypothetical protein